LCVQWGGNDSSTIPFFLQKSRAWIDICDAWLSSSNRHF
jgi:hypothetical protein